MIDYREAFFKNGKHVIFCKIEDLLKDFYKEDSMTSIQTHLEPNGNNWIIHCPFCKEEGHRKHKLYIDADCSRGYCFVCHRIYINVDDEVNKSINLSNFIDKRTKKFTPIELDKNGLWNLDRYRDEFDDYSEKGVKYLVSRNPYLSKLWEPLGIKFFNDNPVLPFKNPEGEVIYYQIRFADAGKDDIRYFFPPIKAKPPYIIQVEGADPEKFVIVEGIFDAIAAFLQCSGRYTIIAVMGSDISDYQIEYIRNWYMPKKILVWMDETELSIKIKNKLKSVFDYSQINILKSYGPDPEEVMLQRMKLGKSIGWVNDSFWKSTKIDLGIKKLLKAL